MSSPSALLLATEFPPGPGGIGTHAHQLALQLVQRGWRVHVVAPQQYVEPARIAAFTAAQPFAISRVRNLPATPLKGAYRVALAAEIARRERPDLLIASGERMVWVGALLTRTLGIPMVSIGHAMEFNVPRRWHRALNRSAFQASAGVICVSEYTAKQMARLGVRPARLAVIPNGADDARFHEVSAEDARAFRAAHRLGDGPLLVTVGSVHARKGQEVVVRAMPQILARFPDAHYVSCGLPIQRDAYQAVARELGVSERVHFLGVVAADELLRALGAADLFVMASQHTPNGDFEGYGIAAVEAALCGRAAVVSDDSGLVEAIEPDVTGVVARSGDPASVATQVNALLADRERLARMGAAAEARARTQQTWGRRGDEYDAFLRDIVGQRARASRASAR